MFEMTFVTSSAHREETQWGPAWGTPTATFTGTMGGKMGVASLYFTIREAATRG